MNVKIKDYGISPDCQKYYVKSKVSAIDNETLHKLLKRLKDELEVKSGKLYITVYFDEEYFPFRSHEAKDKPEDFKTREEIEMMAYLSSILED